MANRRNKKVDVVVNVTVNNETDNNDITDILCILDRSHSMKRIADEAIGGFNAFLEKQKEQAGEARLTLVLFDHEYTIVHDKVSIEEVEPLTSCF